MKTLWKTSRMLLVAAIVALAAGTASAQARVAFVDTEYILKQLPEFRSAQKQLDDIALNWKNELKLMSEDVARLKTAYQAEYLLLPEEQRKEREAEILKREKELREYNQSKFGPGGELDKKRQQLLAPIQDKVFDAIQLMAKQNAIDIVLDKAGAVTLLYANAKFDRSDEVLDILGVATQNANDR